MKRTVNRFAAILLAVLMTAAIASGMILTGCGESESPPATETKLVLDYSGVKTEFEYGEPFTYNGLKVKAEMSDGTTKDLTTGYKVTPPEMTPGMLMVTVTYGELSAKYPIFVNDLTKGFDNAQFANITGPGIYSVEAEDIDLDACKAQPIDSGEATVIRTSSVFASEREVLSNFGAAGNSVGFMFDSNGDYNDVELAVRIGNMTDAEIDVADSVKMYLDFEGSADTGEIDVSGVPRLASHSWATLVFDGLEFSGSSNFIMEFESTADIVWDGVKIIVGSAGVNSDSAVTPATADDPVVIEAENMNLEKFSATDEAIEEHSLAVAQPFVVDSDDGSYVEEIKTGSQLSTVIELSEDANVEISVRANIPSGYSFVDNWSFAVDTFVFAPAASADTDGWQTVSLGTVPLAAGQHIFTAAAVGTTCGIDNFTFDAAVFDGDEVLLVRDDPNADLIVYEYGSYTVQAEDMLDRSGWIPQFGDVDGMIEEWEWTDESGASGYSIGKVAENTVLRFKFSLKKSAKLTLSMRAAKSDVSSTGKLPSNSVSTTVGDVKLPWTSDHVFGNIGAPYTYWNWGMLEFVPVVLEPGDYTIVSERVAGIGFDFYELKFEDPITRLHPGDSLKIEAEELSDRSGWTHNQSTVDNPKTPEDMIESWQNPGAGTSGFCVTKIKSGSIFRIPFTLGERSVVRLNIRIAKYGSNGRIPAGDVIIKLGDKYLTWNSEDNFYNPGVESTDEFKEYSYFRWGTLASAPITLDAGDYTAEIVSGDVSYDWFEISAYDISAADARITGAGEYKFQAEDLLANSDINHSWGGTNPVEYDPNNTSNTCVTSWTYITDNNEGGYCVTRIASGSVFRFKVSVETAVDVTLSVRVAKYECVGSLPTGSFTVKVTGGESELTPTWSSDDDFTHDESTYGLFHFGIAECEPVTLLPGEYTFEITSGDVSYDWFMLTATEAA